MKKLAKDIVANQAANYIAAIIVIVVLSVPCFIFTKKVDVDWVNRVQYILCIMFPTLIVFGSRVQVKPRTRRHLIDFFGNETDIWLEAGYYFTFYLFKLDDKKETQSKERDEIFSGDIKCSDKNRKSLIAEVNGIWVIGTTDIAKRNFKLVDNVEELESVLQKLLSRTATRIIGKHDYLTQILGKELHDEILNDATFKNECINYGIEFPSLVLRVISANQEQDDFNYQKKLLFDEKLKSYPAGYVPSHKELQDINDQVLTELGRAKQLNVRGAAMVRTDMDN